MKKGNKGKIHHVEGKGWYIDTKFPYDGKYLHVFHRWYGTFKQAEADLPRLYAEAIDKHENEKLKSSPTLFDNFVEDWLSMKRATMCPSTMYVHRLVANAYFMPHFKGLPVDEAFKAERVCAFYAYVISKDVEVEMKNSVIRKFKDMLKHAYNLMLIDPKTFQIADVRTPKIRKDFAAPKEPRCITDEELDKFLAEFDEGSEKWYMFRLASAFGMRIAEFLALTPSSFDFNAMTVTVSKQIAVNEFGVKAVTSRLKSRLSYRTIPMTKESAKDASEYIDRFVVGENERLFGYTRCVVDGIIADKCKKAGIKHFTFHAFRHRLAKKLSAKCYTDEDRIARSTILGHLPSVDMDLYAAHDTEAAAARIMCGFVGKNEAGQA